jgi:alkylation response protein AidB-like acyl-CoA dehydrogenase
MSQSAVVALAWSDVKPSAGQFSALAEQQTDSTWRINGRKSFVLNGATANYFIVFARTRPIAGMESTGAFVVEAKAQGIKTGAPQATLGLEAAPFTELHLEDVEVQNGALLQQSDDEQALFRALCRVTLVGAAREAGMTSAAFDFARDYAENRTAFGKPIAHFQGLAFLIADMAIAVEVMQCAIARAAYAFDADDHAAISIAAMAIAECHENAIFVTNNAVQVLGGSGFIRDYPVEKWMRDAKAHMAYGMGHQLCDLIVGRLALQDAPLTLKDDAPLPELQAVML